MAGACLLLSALEIFAAAETESRPAAAASPRPFWRVGIETQALPLSDLGEDGRALGYSVDLIRELAANRRADVTLIIKPWPDLIADFRAGKIDVLAAAAETPDRAPYMDFTSPHLVLSSAMFMRRGELADQLFRLKGRRIGAMPEGPAWEYLKNAGYGAELVPIPHLREGLRQLSERRIDAVLATRMIGYKLVREEHLDDVDAAPVEVPGFTYSLRCAVPEGAEELRASLEAGIANLRADGTFMRVHEKWLGPYEPGWRWIDVRPFVAIGGALLVAGGLALAWQRRLLRRIADQAAEIRAQQERFRLVIEASGDGTWDWDIAGGRVTRDQRTADLMGFSLEQLGETVHAISGRAHPDDREVVKQIRDRILSGEIGAQVEFRAETSVGEWRWFLLRGQVIARDAAGRPTRAAGTMSDIHARKLAEEERRLNQARLQEAQRLEGLGMLAGGVAHDFNNLLTVILGNAGLAREALGSNAQPFLDPIEEAGRRAAELCRQMLAYAGRATVQRQRLDFSALVMETQHLLVALAGPKARVRLELSTDGVGVEGDLTQMRQVLVNFAMNAAESLPSGGGEIVVSTRSADLAPAIVARWQPSCVLAAGRYSCLEVRDRGSGIAADVLPRIFEPFFTTKFTGRGLGLAAALGIARAHGGTIAVESSLGGGSTFRLWLPWVESPAAVENAPRASAAPEISGHGEVLVVDDEAVVRSTIVKLLARFGFTGVEAGSGEAAIAALSSEPRRFSAAIIDLTMPGLDGIQTLERLRGLQPALPAMLVSGFSEDEVRGRLPDAQRVIFLAKPFRPEELAAGVNSMIQSRNGHTR